MFLVFIKGRKKTKKYVVTELKKLNCPYYKQVNAKQSGITIIQRNM